MKDKINISLIDHINYNPFKIYIEAISPTMEISELIRDYYSGLKKD
jgi:hypothetical protein